MNEVKLNEIFIEESKEILNNLESDIVKLEYNFGIELFNNIFRHVHTLKGSSGVAGFDELSDFTHELENLMDSVRSGELQVDKSIIDLLLHSLDWIKDSIFGDGAANMEKNKEELLSRIFEFKGDREEAGKMEEKKEAGYSYFRVNVGFSENVFEFGIDPLMLMADLVSLGLVTQKKVNKDRLPDFDAMDPEKCYLGWNLVLKTRHSLDEVMDVFLFVKDDNDIEVEDVTPEYVIGDDRQVVREKKLGEIMVDRGIVTEGELQDVIETQELQNIKLGAVAVEKGYVTEKDVNYAVEEQERTKTSVDTGTVRVDTVKLDNLMNLLGEIVISQSAINQIADELDDEKSHMLKNALYGFDRITREFQEHLMLIRMIPIGPTFEQFRRFVRDTSHTVGKEISLEIEGGETELDKTMIEKIGDPLKHMIRNSIDHGIEKPDDRLKLGKSRKGTITLKAFHQEGSVHIEVIDDGIGIDIGRIKEKAVDMGLIRADEEVSGSRLLSFLFMPGFSTAKSVGDLSGRGVGMDVVKTNINALRGICEIESEPEKGSTFRIKLPLTLAIIEGMLVRAGEEIYVIPLLSIVESLRPKENDIKTIEGRGEVMQFRGEYVPLLRLYRLFGIKPDSENPWESLVMVVESAGKKIGLMVDELLGQNQTVIKSLESEITYSRAVSSAAILGDGRVALILDIHGLLGDIS